MVAMGISGDLGVRCAVGLWEPLVLWGHGCNWATSVLRVVGVMRVLGESGGHGFIGAVGERRKWSTWCHVVHKFKGAMGVSRAKGEVGPQVLGGPGV